MHAFEPFFQIGKEIVRVFQSAVNAQQRSLREKWPDRAMKMRRNNETFVSSPGIPNAETFKPVEEGCKRRLCDRRELHAEQSARACEIALPDRMAGIAFQRGMQHARHFRTTLKPSGELESRFLVAFQADRHGAQAAQGEEAIIAARTQPKTRMGIRQLFGVCRIGRYITEHHVGVAADIFGHRLDRQVGAVRKRVEMERRKSALSSDGEDVDMDSDEENDEDTVLNDEVCHGTSYFYGSSDANTPVIS